MKRLLWYTACIISLGTGSISSTALAQTTANGPYYATPSWDQTLPANTRFIVLSNMANAAVLDRETGLVWERVPDTTHQIWAFAVRDCNDRTVGNRQGCRLPSIQELRCLLDPTVFNPALPTGHPFTVLLGEGDFYWSATGDGFTGAYGITFRSTTPVTGNKGQASWLALCVRGGSGVDG